MWFCIVVSSFKGVHLSDFSLVSRHGTLYNLTRPHPEPLQKSDLCIRHHRWLSAVWNTGIRGGAKKWSQFFFKHPTLDKNWHSLSVCTQQFFYVSLLCSNFVCWIHFLYFPIFYLCSCHNLGRSETCRVCSNLICFTLIWTSLTVLRGIYSFVCDKTQRNMSTGKHD